MQPTISLCMIVKNEEKMLGACLESVKGKVDECIVIDTGSTDRTVAIAEQHGARVHPFTWVHDFAAARNYSLQLATCDYILVLDADEQLDEQADLRQDVQSAHDYYYVRIKNYTDTGTLLHSSIRLFKNRVGLEFRGRIHEQLNVEEVPGRYHGSEANVYLHHYGYMQSTYQEQNKHSRNYELLLQAVRENPSGYNYMSLGIQYRANGEYEKAFQAFSHAFELSQDKVYLPSLLQYLGDCALNLGWYEEGLHIVTPSLTTFPTYTDLQFMQGRLFEGAGYWKDAEEAYRKCLALGEYKGLVQSVEGVGSYLASTQLANVLLELGKGQDALQAVGAALRLRKHAPALLRYLELTSQANVPAEQVVEELNRIWVVESEQDLKALLLTLYTTRHPLLHSAIEQYGVQVDLKDQAVAKACRNHFAEAVEAWQQVERLEEDNVRDVLFLSLVLGDSALLDRYRHQLNMTKHERQMFMRLVRGEQPTSNESMSPRAGTLFVALAEQLVKQQQFERFETLMTWAVAIGGTTLVAVCRMLAHYGFSEIAHDVLVDMLEQQYEEPDLLALLGDLSLTLQQMDNALYLYQQLIGRDPSYANYYRLHALYKRMGDAQNARRIQVEMKLKFPHSVWAKE